MKEIKLIQNQVALVDNEDYELLNSFKWQFILCKDKGYAKREYWDKNLKKYFRIFMHKQILNDAKIVDHKNRNGLDNRRENLRSVTTSQNAMNSRVSKNSVSGYKGVGFVKSHNMWRCRIMIQRKEFTLGEYSTAIEAAQSYNIAAQHLFGEFANLNEVPEPNLELINKVRNKIALRDLAVPSNSTTGYRGVQVAKSGNYVAKIFIKPKQVAIGYYDTALEAAEAYNQKALELFGDKAQLNKI